MKITNIVRKSIEDIYRKMENERQARLQNERLIQERLIQEREMQRQEYLRRMRMYELNSMLATNPNPSSSSAAGGSLPINTTVPDSQLALILYTDGINLNYSLFNFETVVVTDGIVMDISSIDSWEVYGMYVSITNKGYLFIIESIVDMATSYTVCTINANGTFNKGVINEPITVNQEFDYVSFRASSSNTTYLWNGNSMTIFDLPVYPSINNGLFPNGSVILRDGDENLYQYIEGGSLRLIRNNWDLYRGSNTSPYLVVFDDDTLYVYDQELNITNTLVDEYFDGGDYAVDFIGESFVVSYLSSGSGFVHIYNSNTNTFSSMEIEDVNELYKKLNNDRYRNRSKSYLGNSIVFVFSKNNTYLNNFYAGDNGVKVIGIFGSNPTFDHIYDIDLYVSDNWKCKSDYIVGFGFSELDGEYSNKQLRIDINGGITISDIVYPDDRIYVNNASFADNRTLLFSRFTENDDYYYYYTTLILDTGTYSNIYLGRNNGDDEIRISRDIIITQLESHKILYSKSGIEFEEVLGTADNNKTGAINRYGYHANYIDPGLVYYRYSMTGEYGSLVYFSDANGGTISINDGAFDMFDGGNMFQTNLSEQIPYTHTVFSEDGEIFPNWGVSPSIYPINGTIDDGTAYFGTGSSYFTNLYPGTFIAIVDSPIITSFNIDGDLGSDSRTIHDMYNFEIPHNGLTYGVYVKTSNDNAANDPSVNQIIITDNNVGLTQNGITTFGNDNMHHEVSAEVGDMNIDRIYYLLIGLRYSVDMTQTQIENVVSDFLDLIHPDEGDILTISEAKTALSDNLNADGLSIVTENIPSGTQSSIRRFHIIGENIDTLYQYEQTIIYQGDEYMVQGEFTNLNNLLVFYEHSLENGNKNIIRVYEYGSTDIKHTFYLDNDISPDLFKKVFMIRYDTDNEYLIYMNGESYIRNNVHGGWLNDYFYYDD